MGPTDDEAQHMLSEAMTSIDDYYKSRGLFQAKFGFGKTPAIVVVDFAYGWTDEAYPYGSRRLDGPVDRTRELLDVARPKGIPIVYTTSSYRPGDTDTTTQASEAATDLRPTDQRACHIDQRVAPTTRDVVIEKDTASAFFGTHLASHLIEHHVDTLLITGCSTSACVRATATDAHAYRFRPIIVRDCVGDRCAAAHVFTLFDIQARFADVVDLDDALEYVAAVSSH